MGAVNPKGRINYKTGVGVFMSEETQEAVAESQEAVEHTEQGAKNVDENREKTGLQEALIAERRKRQEAEYRSRFLEQQYQNYASQFKTKQADQDDDDEYTKELKQYTESQIQNGIKQALETQFIRQHPHIVEQDPETGQTWLEQKLSPILQKKPWLAQGIQMAENRYERALEIIEDYTPKSEPRHEEAKKKLEENASKPGSPAGVAKSGNLSSINKFKNMSRKEFSEYRAKILGKPPNIR